MTFKSRSPRLPRLQNALGESEGHASPSPRDLRGASYSRLQDQPRHRERVVLLPSLGHGEEHPMPYYETKDVLAPVVVARPCRTKDTKPKSQAKQVFSRDLRLQQLVVEDIVDDALAEEVVAAASAVLEESKYEEEKDRRAATLVEEEFIMPEVQRQVYLCVWGQLYDLGRTLPGEEFLEMKKREKELRLNPVAKHALATHVLQGENWAKDLKEEKILSELPWDLLVFNYHKNLQENALTKNVTLQKFLEKVVLSVAQDEIFEGMLLDALEDDMREVDQMEKVASPPRLA